MIELAVVFGVTVVLLCGLIAYLLILGSREREKLEDRLMALSHPEGLVQYKAVEKPIEGDVSYIDEQFEFEHGTES